MNEISDERRAVMTGIDNTSERMKDPAEKLLFLAEAMGAGSQGPPIEQMERDGQRQLVNSDRLPSDVKGDRAGWEALGFTFGDPDPDDPMFMPATLPPGWKREGSDHAMWSYLKDGLGRQRAAIFYKAAFYDRSAFMHLITVGQYADTVVAGRARLLLDDSWATREAVAEAVRAARAYADEQVTFWREHPGGNSERYIAEHEADASKCDELLAALERAPDPQ